MHINIPFQKLKDTARLPDRAHPTDAGYDVFAAADTTLPPNSVTPVPLGFAVAIPDKFWLWLTDKSGLARKHNLCAIGGVVDPGYRNEVMALIQNSGDVPYEFKQGDKVCQAIALPRISIGFVEQSELPASRDRGMNGFGSTGR